MHDRHYDLLYTKDYPSNLERLFDMDKDLNNLIIDIDILSKEQEAQTDAKLAEELERLRMLEQPNKDIRLMNCGHAFDPEMLRFIINEEFPPEQGFYRLGPSRVDSQQQFGKIASLCFG